MSSCIIHWWRVLFFLLIVFQNKLKRYVFMEIYVNTVNRINRNIVSEIYWFCCLRVTRNNLKYRRVLYRSLHRGWEYYYLIFRIIKCYRRRHRANRYQVLRDKSLVCFGYCQCHRGAGIACCINLIWNRGIYQMKFKCKIINSIRQYVHFYFRHIVI